MKERVFAYDFESPEQRMMNKRKADLHTLEAKSSLLAKMCEGLEPYPIGAIRPAANGYTSQELDVIERNFRKAKASGDGYIICDFPGRFGAQEAVYRLSAAGLIDLMAFPVVPEEQSVQSMFIINKFLSNPKFYLVPDYRQQVMCFWNMVTRNDSGKRSKTDIMGQYEKLFEMDGMKLEIEPEVLDLIVDTAIARKLGARGLRSICEELMNDAMFEAPSSRKKTYTLTLAYAQEKLKN